MQLLTYAMAVVPALSLVLAAPGGCQEEEEPTIVFTRPVDGDTIRLDPDTLSAPVSFEVTGFELGAPGTCGSVENCGHVHLQIDGDLGNQDGLPYNNAAAASPMDAFFWTLENPTGEHVLTLMLVHDDHSPTGVEASVTVYVVDG